MPIKDKNLYYIGGVVRDEVLGVSSIDIDYCYEGDAINFARNMGLDIKKENPDFGTVRVIQNDKEIDIASTRTESYPRQGHLPEVKDIGCPLFEDLKRRDFTINALAKNTMTGEIIDYFSGLADIENRMLRVLHDNSFNDDPTRIIRGLKFATRFNFVLDDKTKSLQDAYLKNINYDMSYHRLKKELKETFNLNSVHAFNSFIEQNIYKLLGNQPKPIGINVNIENLIKKYNPQNVWLIYLGIFDLSALSLDSEEQKIVNEFNEIKNIIPDNDIDIYKLFKNKPLETILLYSAYVNETIALRFIDNLVNTKIEISGNDLLELGFSNGKIFNEIFEFILNKKLQDPTIDRNKEISLVKKHFL